jgi:hypothetical protein
VSIQIESDLKEILTRIDTKLDKLSEDVTELKVNTVRLSPPAPNFGGARFVKVPQDWGGTGAGRDSPASAH